MFAGGEFGVAGRAAEGGEVQLADDLVVRLRRLVLFHSEQLRDAALCVGDLVGEDVTVERVQGLREVLVR